MTSDHKVDILITSKTTWVTWKKYYDASCDMECKWRNPNVDFSNPVAALATLILLSYAALFRTVLETLSFTVINYPESKVETVWLPDPSIKYFWGKHVFYGCSHDSRPGVYLPLILMAMALTIPNKRMFRWIRNTKLHLLIEAYQAPYRPKYRYRTGLLLLVRIKHIVQNPRCVTKPKPIASTHTQMCPRIAHLLSIASMKLAAKILRGWARVHVTWSTTLLSFRAERFLTTAAYSFVFIVWGCDRVCLSMRTICWCSPPPQRWPRIAVKGVYRHNFWPVHF